MSYSLLEKSCPFCTFEAPKVAILLSHLRTVHANDPRFSVTCGLNGCRRTSKSFSALYSHVYRHHQGYIRKRNSQDEELPSTESHLWRQELEISGESVNNACIASFNFVFNFITRA